MIMLCGILVIVCGVTGYGWWIFIRKGYFNSTIAGVATLVASTATLTPVMVEMEVLPTDVPTVWITPTLQLKTATVSSLATQTPAITQSLLDVPTIDKLALSWSGSTRVIRSTSTVVPRTMSPLTQVIQSNITTPTVDMLTATSTFTIEEAEPTSTPDAQWTETVSAAPSDQLSGHIVFPAYNASVRNWDLYLTDTRGSQPTVLYEQASQPAFSADGSRLAFRHRHPSFLGLRAINMGTGETTQLTGYAEDAWPNWSYEVGSMLLFSSQRQSDRRWRIYGLIMDNQVLDWELAVNNKPVYGHYPLWLPGNNMLYAGCVMGECGLILADGDASNPHPLTRNPGDLVPDISPNGQWIAYMMQSDTNWDLHLVNVATGETSGLLKSEADEGSPEWSPDGSHLGFVSNRDGHVAIWAIAFDTAQETMPQELPDAVKLFELTDLPPEGWPWLEERIAWGP